MNNSTTNVWLLSIFSAVILFSTPTNADFNLNDANKLNSKAQESKNGNVDLNSNSNVDIEISDTFLLSSIKERINKAKLELWKRGAFDLDEDIFLDATLDFNLSPPHSEFEKLSIIADRMESYAKFAPLKLGPIRESRRYHKNHYSIVENDVLPKGLWNKNYRRLMMEMRGGSLNNEETQEDTESRLEKLGALYGSEFIAAIEKNKQEHKNDCDTSCESFYCAKSDITGNNDTAYPTFHSYSFGPVPPEDFAEDFGFPLDLIKVSKDGFFPPSEAAEVVAIAEEEGLSSNEYKSGKYKLGGDWLLNLPRTRDWFNKHLESTFFPLLTQLFPEIISSPSVLRAHSVSLLKYNSSHPRTDVHIDNGILAMTIAMTPSKDYVGGGTFFEHMGLDHILPMDVGYGTFRPGSVRHGGHRVESGTRYILGAFLLIEDRVEHVRRLKNRGAALRKSGDLDGAIKHFQWALALNPRCCTCLKDWAEILQFRKDFEGAEKKIRKALDYLEDRDSDALFMLGQILSEQGKDEESIAAYTKSVSLNAEDSELCYNLGVKYGARGDTKKEMDMYARATKIDPEMGGAWINWGSALAEQNDLDEAAKKFEIAIECCQDVAPKAMLNLALVYHSKAAKLVRTGNIEAAKSNILIAGKKFDAAKPMLDELSALAKNQGKTDDDAEAYISRFRPLRLNCHKLAGQILAGLKDFAGCEKEFQIATDSFPNEPGAWDMLARVLEIQGKLDDAKAAKEKVATLKQLNGAFGFGL